jgi:predicted amidophosphoribosyltransferase
MGMSHTFPRWFRRRKKLDFLLSFLRSCAVCSSALPPIDLLCLNCWQKAEEFFKKEENVLRHGYPFAVYSLVNWKGENDVFFRKMIFGLKKGYSLSASQSLFSRLAFARHWPIENGHPIFVHPPSSSGRPDHAAVMAVQLAHLWGGYPLGLAWDQEHQLESSQRGKSAVQRGQRRFAETDLARFTEPEIHWVFVDDVITTGSTAMAAYMALGCPEKFEVWTLACRPKLAVKDDF